MALAASAELPSRLLCTKNIKVVAINDLTDKKHWPIF